MPTIIKANQALETDCFRLHYFPDIPFECAYPDEKSNVDCGAFEQIDFDVSKQSSGTSAGRTHTRGGAGSAAGAVTKPEAADYEAGFQKGHDDGYQAGLREAAAGLSHLKEIAAQLELFKQKIYAQAEKDIVDLALAVSKKILGQEVTNNPDAVLAVVKTALQRVTDHTRITIRLNPSDLETVKKAEPRLSAYFENSSAVDYEADECIAQGGCLIETNFGDIDARLDHQFQAIAEVLRSDASDSV